MLYFLRIFLSKRFYVQRSLRKIFGIGLTRAKKIHSLLGLHPKSNRSNFFNLKKKSLIQRRLNKISISSEKTFILDYELKRIFTTAIKTLKNIKCYRGFRHVMLLPTRGQRTHSNASTFKKVVLSRRIRYNKINDSKKKQIKIRK